MMTMLTSCAIVEELAIVDYAVFVVVILDRGLDCFLGKDGAMYKSKWLKLKSGKKYYLKSDGKAVTGLVKINGITYKFDDDGLCLGKNNHFILNKDTLCLHGIECWNAEKIKSENYDEINIGTDEFDEKSKEGFWACGVKNCNSASVCEALPKK